MGVRCYAWQEGHHDPPDLAFKSTYHISHPLLLLRPIQTLFFSSLALHFHSRSLPICFSMSAVQASDDLIPAEATTMPSKLAQCVVGIDVGGTNTDR